jgi:hypothetical protein
MKDITDNPDFPWNYASISINEFNKNKIVRKKIDDRIEYRTNVFSIITGIMIKDISYLCVMYL